MIDIHKLKKIGGIAISYGWVAFLYGTLFTFIPNEFGYTLPLFLRGAIPIAIFGLSVWYAYKIEMKMYTPSSKYWTIMFMAFVGFFALLHYSYLYPLWYLGLMGGLSYKCSDCVTYSRVES